MTIIEAVMDMGSYRIRRKSCPEYEYMLIDDFLYLVFSESKEIPADFTKEEIIANDWEIVRLNRL